MIIGALLAGGALLLLGFYNPELHSFPKCPFKFLTGFMCPGCGSQRAIHYAMRGQFGDAFRMNALFLPGVIYGLIGYMVSVFMPTQWLSLQPRWYGKTAAYVALVVILVFWVGRNVV